MKLVMKEKTIGGSALRHAFSPLLLLASSSNNTTCEQGVMRTTKQINYRCTYRDFGSLEGQSRCKHRKKIQGRILGQLYQVRISICIPFLIGSLKK
jgi:hypothetical protein